MYGINIHFSLCMNGMRRIFGLGVFLGIAVTGCDTLSPRFCTDMGCYNDGLIVELQGTMADEFTVMAEAVGEEPRVMECSPAAPCGSTVFFEDFTPEQVRVTYSSAAGSIERTFSPTYVVARPNGPHCPPACRQGTVQFQID